MGSAARRTPYLPYGVFLLGEHANPSGVFLLVVWHLISSSATLLRMSNELATNEDEVAAAGAADNWLLDTLRDPSQLGFPPMLPIELALRLDTPQKICAAYNIPKDEFVEITRHPVFIKAYKEAVEALKTEGVSFKMKARMQAEDYLATAYAMVKNANTSDAVRADLIKATTRWAGYDAKENAAGAGTGFNIQINLG